MNTLFIAPYRQKDGWGLASRSYIKALATKSNIGLTTRPVYFISPDESFDDQQIIEYENSLHETYDVAVQMTLPHCLFLNRSYQKNIGLFFLETNDIYNSECISNINKMDEIWTPSKIEQQCLIKSGVIKPIKIVSQPLDTEFIEANKSHKLQMNPFLDNMFKFYFIGENIFRKNLRDLIIAFHLAFEYSEPVCLIIKTNGQISSIEEQISQIKSSLGISNKYKKEIIINQYMSYKDLIGLHNACDCFVAPSYGESFCRPAAEALVLGKTPIVNCNTGMRDFINDDNGFLVKSNKTPVISDNQRTLSKDFDLYNANEYWYKIDIYDLISKMQEVYNLHRNKDKKLQSKKENGLSAIANFSYKNIGSKLCI